VVIVMVEDGVSGEKTCAPVAGAIYRWILERERLGSRPPVAGRLPESRESENQLTTSRHR
jgi:hypothetical protein